jgi:alkyldihydroxyacetonephosphate synthase
MESSMLSTDQKRMAAAVARVFADKARAWNETRTGDLPTDLSALARRVRRRLAGAPDDIDRGPRKFWGWGYENDGPDPLMVEVFLAYLQERFGLDGFPEIPAPRIEDLDLRAPRFALPADLSAFCRDDALTRAAHSYGKAYRDIVRALHGQFDNPTDYVAFPETEDQIEALLRFCETESIAMVVYGGGSSVVGGVNPPESSRYRGVITVDMAKFDQVLAVEEHSRAVRAQAGIYGPALEAALKPYGLSPRFYPQSFEFSTLGGWIATRAGGHYCTLYTHIDDILEAVRVVTPAGVHETRRLPASGAGISQERLWLGSEGTLGIITEAWIRVHARPQHRSNATVKFATFEAGAAAVHALSQGKLHPVNCRLVDALEAVSMGLGDGKHAMLLLGFESEHYPQRDALAKAIDVCRTHGGKPSTPRHTERSGGARSGSAGRWRNNFLKAPYLRDILAQKGLVIETFETAVTWDQFASFHQAILDAAQQTFERLCQGRGLITCRFTHIYPDGPAPYYSMVAWAPEGEQVATWDAIKAAVSDAILAFGGTITHHHAVGKDHRPWYEKERGALFETTLRGLKSTLDPEWILNPGVLLAEPEPRDVDEPME